MSEYYVMSPKEYVDFCENVIGMERVKTMTVGEIAEEMRKAGRSIRCMNCDEPEEAYSMVMEDGFNLDSRTKNNEGV